MTQFLQRPEVKGLLTATDKTLLTDVLTASMINAADRHIMLIHQL